MRRALVGIVLCAAAVLALGGCSSSPSASPPSSSTPSSTPRSSASSSTPAAPSGDGSAITRAVRSYQSSQGIATSQYRIAGIQISTVDPSWAKFEVGPLPSDVTTFQGGYGFVHRSAGEWRVVTGLGTAEVGCPLTGATTPAAATYVAVPPNVLSAFGFACPPSAT